MNINKKQEAGRNAGNRDGMSSAAMPHACQGGVSRETADGYRGTLIDFGRYRLAVCRDGLQWLYQRRRPGFAGGGAQWDTLGYCVTRAALIRLHHSHSGTDAPEMARLPEGFKREGEQ